MPGQRADGRAMPKQPRRGESLRSSHPEAKVAVRLRLVGAGTAPRRQESMPAPGLATRNRSGGPAPGGRRSTSEEVLAAFDTVSRRMQDLARSLGCLGFFNDDDDDRPRAA